MKEARFLGNSRENIGDFPRSVRRSVGVELMKVQYGFKPSNWKPMPSVGAGVEEIRVSEDNGIFRVIYVAKFEEAVYVLHAFQKKSKKGISTAKSDIKLIEQRLTKAKDYHDKHYKK